MCLGTGIGVLHLDEEPMLLASSWSAHADQRELALEFCAVQRKLQLACCDALGHRLRDRPVCEYVVVGTLIPDGHRTSPVLPFRNRAFECRIGERVVLDMDGQALLRRRHRGGLRHRPALEHTLRLQAEIIMQSADMVLLHDKNRPLPLTLRLQGRCGRWFRGLLEIALVAIRCESHGCPLLCSPSTCRGSSSALAGPGRLLRGGRALGEGTRCRGGTPLATTLLRGRLVELLAAACTALLAAAGHFVHSGPGAPRRLFFRYAALLVALFNVLGLAFLFFCVLGLVSSWHLSALLQDMFRVLLLFTSVQSYTICVSKGPLAPHDRRWSLDRCAVLF